MKKILTILILFISGYAHAQFWTRPNTSYGNKQFRISIDSTFLFPTGNGAPSLHSAATSDTSGDTRKAALYYDSTGHSFYVYDPKLRAWVTLGESGGGSSPIYAGYGTYKPDSTHLIADTTFGKVLFSRYQGKRFYFPGDSYTYSNYYQPSLKRGLGCDTVSDGIPGSTITGQSTGTRSIVSRIDAALATNPDVLFLVGGTNDWALSKPLGTPSSTDTLTFIGAYRYILLACLAKTYGLKVFCVTPLQRGFSRSNYASQKAYTDAIINLCAQYSIPVIDAFNGSGITYENMNVYSTDGIHPDKPAGLKKYGDFLVAGVLSEGSTFPNINPATGGSWLLAGNTGTDSATNFIGTIDAQPLVFRVNNMRAGKIDYNGQFNTSLGDSALASNTTGASNNAFGAYVLKSNTTGTGNTGNGNQALANNTTGSGNTSIGYQGSFFNSSGINNTSIGYRSAYTNTTSSNITAIGYNTLRLNTAASNTAIGTQAGESNSTGIQNMFSGMLSGSLNTTGQQNLFAGFNSGTANTTGSFNTFTGRTSGAGITTGSNNVAVGYNTYGLATGSIANGVAIGSEAGFYETSSNKLHIANNRIYSLINGDFSTQFVGISPMIMSLPVLSGSPTGGSLAAGTYLYVVTARDGTGGETAISAQVGYTATGTTSSISITWPAVPYAVGYRVYRGTTTGVYTNYFATTSLTFTETGTTGTAGVPVVSNSAYLFRVNSGVTQINGRFQFTGLRDSTGAPQNVLYVDNAGVVHIGSAVSGGGGSGVTSISQGYGITNTPNPIISTGTIKVDTTTLFPAIRATIPAGGGSGTIPTIAQVLGDNPGVSNITNGYYMQLDDNNETYLANASGNPQVVSDASNGLVINNAAGNISANFNEHTFYNDDGNYAFHYEPGETDFAYPLYVQNGSAFGTHEGDKIQMSNNDGSAKVTIDADEMTVPRTQSYQDKSGTIALTDDISQQIHDSLAGAKTLALNSLQFKISPVTSSKDSVNLIGSPGTYQVPGADSVLVDGSITDDLSGNVGVGSTGTVIINKNPSTGTITGIKVEGSAAGNVITMYGVNGTIIKGNLVAHNVIGLYEEIADAGFTMVPGTSYVIDPGLSSNKTILQPSSPVTGDYYEIINNDDGSDGFIYSLDENFYNPDGSVITQLSPSTTYTFRYGIDNKYHIITINF